MAGKMPLVEKLYAHMKHSPVSFHVPGHKGGGLYQGIGVEGWGGILGMDVTEIPGMDNLHCSGGVIAEAQKLAAEAYGVDHTYFLVNGTTGGIQAALLAATRPGDKVIIDRFCHSSVINGIMLGRLRPVYVWRAVDGATGIPLSVDLDKMRRAVKNNRDASAILVTSPTYYGICSDIKAISELAYRHGKILIVDEAHGAHLRFGGGLPESAVTTGADIVVQSAHKTLPAMTQGSWLHVKGSRVDVDRLERMLSIMQTTSPSYPIMASLDMARHIMAAEGAGRLEEIVNRLEKAREDISGAGRGLFTPAGEYFKDRGCFDFDKTKLVINCSQAGISGRELDSRLRQENIYGEMYDLANWLGVVTVGNRPADLDRLVRACSRIETAAGNMPQLPGFDWERAPDGIDPYEVLERDCGRMPLEDAQGMISAAGIIPYPPGVPLVCPGERIGAGAVERIKQFLAIGINVKGYRDGKVEVAMEGSERKRPVV